ncbi:putative V-type proton ATPase 21 kDa proteolipid subunit-like [Capsicum annuum]|nr:putative V-type proton ATPase 21 kDa proteolipid subunit-like [Capsicum annuum]
MPLYLVFVVWKGKKLGANQATDGETKVSRTLTRDENFNFRAAYWADLHKLLYGALPVDIVLWGYFFLSFSMYDDKSKVKVEAKDLEMGVTVDIVADLLIAADGCLSSIRQSFCQLINEQMKSTRICRNNQNFYFNIEANKERMREEKYSDYCAWRGILDSSNKEHSEAIIILKKLYPDLGKCLYFDLSAATHCVFYELLNHRFNWIWYINQPEPNLKGNSVTMKVSENLVQSMHEEAEKTWVPEFVRIFWDKEVLIGDAAHPTTPHGLRSTNMSILDADVLGKCLEKWEVENLNSALKNISPLGCQLLRSRFYILGD